jgi:hypothetical protein
MALNPRASNLSESPRDSVLSKKGGALRLSKDEDSDGGGGMRSSTDTDAFSGTYTARKKGPKSFLSGVRFHAKRTIHTKIKHRKNDETFKAAYQNYKDSVMEVQELKAKLEPLRKLYKGLILKFEQFVVLICENRTSASAEFPVSGFLTAFEFRSGSRC